MAWRSSSAPLRVHRVINRAAPAHPPPRSPPPPCASATVGRCCRGGAAPRNAGRGRPPAGGAAASSRSNTTARRASPTSARTPTVHRQRPHQLGERAIVRILRRDEPQRRDRRRLLVRPVAMQISRVRVEEQQPHLVRTRRRIIRIRERQMPRHQRMPQRIPRQNVIPPPQQQRRHRRHRPQQRQRPRHRHLRTRHALPPRRNRTRQREQMPPLVVVEVERPRERLDDRVTRVRRLPLLEPRVGRSAIQIRRLNDRKRRLSDKKAIGAIPPSTAPSTATTMLET